MDISKIIFSEVKMCFLVWAEMVSEKTGVPLQELLEIVCENQDLSYTNDFLPLIKQRRKQNKKKVTLNATKQTSLTENNEGVASTSFVSNNNQQVDDLIDEDDEEDLINKVGELTIKENNKNGEYNEDDDNKEKLDTKKDIKEPKVNNKLQVVKGTPPLKTRSPKAGVTKCEYIFNKGAKKGTRCSTGTKSGTKFCGKHKQLNN
ncbi:hypothetical protein [Dasineura jujubifolia toursvirus 2a]|nr:hypothetical protein [Dasineura jujubifolia toursvirus 2a]